MNVGWRAIRAPTDTFLVQNASQPQILTDSFHIASLGGSHLACGRRGDMAIFGDLATINIFYKKWSYISQSAFRHEFTNIFYLASIFRF